MNYSTEVTQRLSKIFLALLDLLGSKKFLAAAGAGLTGWYQTGDARMLVGSILTFVLAQGVADHGKEKAFVDMATAAMSGRTAPKEELVFRPAPPIQAATPAITGKPVGTLFPVYITEALVMAGLLTIESILAATDDELKAAGLTDSQVYKVREMINLATLK